MVKYSLKLSFSLPHFYTWRNPSLSALHFFRLSEDYAENIANRRNSNELRRFLFPDSLSQTTKKETA